MFPLKYRPIPVRGDGCNNKVSTIPAKGAQSRGARRRTETKRQLLSDQDLAAKLVKIRRRQDVTLIEGNPEKRRVPADEIKVLRMERVGRLEIASGWRPVSGARRR